MAIFIFCKDSDGVMGALYRIASNQSIYDANKNWQDDMYDVVAVNDDDYTAVKLGNKSVITKNENQVIYEDNQVVFTDEGDLTSYIKNIIPIFEVWLEVNNSKPLAPNVITYLNYIKSLDVSSLSITEDTPLNYSLEAYVENQGITAIHPLELL